MYYLLSKTSARFTVPLLFLIIAGMLGLYSCISEKQSSNLRISSSPVEIEWQLISNFEPDNNLRAALTLINSGDKPIPAEGWALYFNSIRILNTDSFPAEFKVSHIGGYFFKLEPTEHFEPIEAGERLDIEYLARYFAIKKSDAPEGFYFVFDDGSIETVETVTVAPMDGPEQANRSPNDNIPVPTPEFTYEENERLEQLHPSEIIKVTPTPAGLTSGEGSFSFQDRAQIYYHPSFEKEAGFLATSLREQLEIDVNVEPADETGDNSQQGIFLNKSDGDFSTEESYSLDITSESVRISADAEPGIFYGIQSLRSLIANRDSESHEIPAVSIQDEPAFSYRGMHLDVARNFQDAGSVKQLLDIMAIYKLNKFHFHLTDDEGWRIAIDPLPELTQVGGRRGHTETEEDYMIPVYGSGPDPAPGNSFGSGWFSRQEYIDIITYADERHIEVIPEIDMPGHARAAILAMKARANRFLKDGDTDAAGEFRLDEPEDESSYRSVQNYTDNVVNVCSESTYRFLELVIDELAAMHKEADVPLNSIHMGGDEVPHGAWEESPDCATLMEEREIENVRDLQVYFFTRVSDLLQQRNISMGGWEEVAFREIDGNQEINPDFTDALVPYVWSNVWGGDTEDRAYRLANAGFPVVMSHASNFYFDFAYNKHWREPGFYWGAMFATETPFSFQPFTLFQNAENTNYGDPLPANYFEDKVQLQENARSNILGLQGQLWTETVNEERLWEYMVMPKLLGLAERAWQGQPRWAQEADSTAREQMRLEAWNEFANRIGHTELARLDRLYPEINYRIPPPGAVIEEDQLRANISLPGLTIRYELDGSEPTETSPEFTGPVDISENDRPRLAAFSTTGRSSRTVEAVRTDTR